MENNGKIYKSSEEVSREIRAGLNRAIENIDERIAALGHATCIEVSIDGDDLVADLVLMHYLSLGIAVDYLRELEPGRHLLLVSSRA